MEKVEVRYIIKAGPCPALAFTSRAAADSWLARYAASGRPIAGLEIIEEKTTSTSVTLEVND